MEVSEDIFGRHNWELWVLLECSGWSPGMLLIVLKLRFLAQELWVLLICNEWSLEIC